MDRYLRKSIEEDLKNKIVLLSGPRQVGKTTLSKNVACKTSAYLNYDDSEDRKIIMSRSWDRNVELLIFDELHKMKKWKSWIKGIYDTNESKQQILVTGSARMDTYKKGGDSLAGRHFSYRLYPLSIAELCGQMNPDMAMDIMLRVGGFPEPFLKGSEHFYKRWRKSHLERILREDLLDLEKVREIKLMEILVDLLAERVGSPISFSSLARDLEISPHTVKKWISILESLYVVFIVPPYTKKIARAILKEPKIFFYDIARVKNEIGARMENFVALSLKKRLDFLEDTSGERNSLFYLRDKEKREVDFLTVRDQKLEWAIEVKTSDAQLSSNLKYYRERLSMVKTFQLVFNLKRDLTIGGTDIVNVGRWLANLEA
ncbi:MAG: ATP-binding protein [Oligoflexales bacterium]|nr:ATP-binding protein [Oligoflexales bacterium]